jgi:hypothetical protein
MFAIWTRDEETAELGHKDVGGVAVEDGLDGIGDTVRGLGSAHNLEGNVTAEDEVVGEPDGGETAISKLVNHLVAKCLVVDLVELVAEVDWMEAIPLVFLEVLDMLQVGGCVLELRSHAGRWEFGGGGCSREQLTTTRCWA